MTGKRGGGDIPYPDPEVAGLLADTDPELSDREGWLYHADGRPFSGEETTAYHSASVVDYLAAMRVMLHDRDRAESLTVTTRELMLLALPSRPWHPEWLYRRRWRRWQQLVALVLAQGREGGDSVTLAENHRLMHEHATATADAYRRLILPLLHWRQRREALGVLARLDPSGPEALAAAGHKTRRRARNRARQ